MSKATLTDTLTLDGLIHLWGAAGSGKTLFACSIAAEISSYSKVEWINTDSKHSFIPFLKRTIDSVGGVIQNVCVSMMGDRNEALDHILGLPQSLQKGVSLVVIDPITRLLDMARKNPILWGRELVEEVLPTLAGLVQERGLTIIITSESRELTESGNLAVHYRNIKKWVDHDLVLVRQPLEDSTRILRVIDTLENREQLGVLRLQEDGSPTVQPYLSRVSELVGGNS
ncbi:MAG: hypothetical protein ACFFE2_07080 [Candidatus Thorarchaeota archaeon]